MNKRCMMSCLTCALLWGSDAGEQRCEEPAHCISAFLRWQPVTEAQEDQDSVNCCRICHLFSIPPCATSAADLNRSDVPIRQLLIHYERQRGGGRKERERVCVCAQRDVLRLMRSNSACRIRPKLNAPVLESPERVRWQEGRPENSASLTFLRLDPTWADCHFPSETGYTVCPRLVPHTGPPAGSAVIGPSDWC